MKKLISTRPSADELTSQFISRIEELDLSKLNIQLSKLKEYRELMLVGEHQAADDLYVSVVMNSLLESDLKEFHDDLVAYARKRGGKRRGEKKTEGANDVKRWLYPLLAECDAEFPTKRISKGWKSLQNLAMRKVTKNDLDDPRKEYLTRYRIQAWIDEGRPKNQPN